MNEPIESQVCRGCNVDKPLSDFHKDRTQKTGHKHTCKKCRSTVQGRLKTSKNKPSSPVEEDLSKLAVIRAIQELQSRYEMEYRQLLKYHRKKLGITSTWQELK